MARLLIVMGVSGVGKSTLACALSDHYNYLYLDADDFHSEQAKTRMSSGHPLTDDMRTPWIKRICTHLRDLSGKEQSVALAFSGLKKQHRDPLRQCGFDTLFLFLNGDSESISERISSRTDHFMPSELLTSQFASLEVPDLEEEPDVISIEANSSGAEVLNKTINLIDSRYKTQYL